MKWHFAADCRRLVSCDATRMGSHPDPLFALRLDRTSLDAAWDGAVARLRSRYGDIGAAAMLKQAADNLAHWRANPAPWDLDFVMPEDAP